MKMPRRVRPWHTIVAAVAIVVMSAGGVGAWYILTTPKPQPPKAAPSPAAPSPEPPTPKQVAPSVSPPAPTTPPPAKPIPAPTPKPAPFNKSAHSTTAAGSLWVVVNKAHKLAPVTYAPPSFATVGGAQVGSTIAADLKAMIAAAAKSGISLPIASGYRSYNTQSSVYNGYVSQYGQATADTISARPGHSEHQTGLAVDMGSSTNPGCTLNVCYQDTVEGKWIAAHAGEYGFIIRYTASNGSITGYSPEPWHLRYVGRALVQEMQRTGIGTLEQFFGVSGGTAYVD